MGWDKGGRVVREYVGGGTLGQLATQLDAIEREKRECKFTTARAERDEVAALDGLLAELSELADLLARGAGRRRVSPAPPWDWRKRRDNAHQID